jgi:hypothetical protein
MSAVTIFLALCIAGVPFLVYVFISFCRDSKREYQSTCQIVKMRQSLIVLEPPEECGSVPPQAGSIGEANVLAPYRGKMSNAA